VRTAGGIPGGARPIVVLRAYQGPQGFYTEHFTLTDRDGTEVARSGKQRIRLSGEAFEDSFETVITDIHLRSGAEHTAHFFVDGVEVGAIPVFIESGMGGDPSVAAEETFKKAVQKGSVIWLTVPQPAPRGRGRNQQKVAHHTQPVWFVFEGGKLYVLNGPTEQQVPNLGNVSEVSITARSKDHRSKVSDVLATVRVLPADDDRWEKIARAGLGKRLNLPDGDAALERWREHCTLYELTPRFREVDEAGGAARPAGRLRRHLPPLRGRPTRRRPQPARRSRRRSLRRRTSTSRSRSTRRSTTSSSPRARASASPAPRRRPPTCVPRRPASARSAKALPRQTSRAPARPRPCSTARR
jgi:hypothetical protein